MSKAKVTLTLDTEQLEELRSLVDARSLSATVDSSRIGEAMALLTAHGITSLTVAPPSLESLFLRLYGDDAEDGAIR